MFRNIMKTEQSTKQIRMFREHLFRKHLNVRENFLKIFQNKTKYFGLNKKFRKIMKTGQSNKQVRVFRNTFENVLMFRNTFEMFLKQI